MRFRDGSVRKVKLHDARAIRDAARTVLDHEGLGGISRLTIIGGEFGVEFLYPIGTSPDAIRIGVDSVGPFDNGVGVVPVRTGYIPVKRPRR